MSSSSNGLDGAYFGGNYRHECAFKEHMLKLTPSCLAVILLLQGPALAARAAPPAVENTTATAVRIDALVAPLYKAADPGATILVIKDGKTLLRKSYDMADIDKGTPMRPDMGMRIGSITKQFTATAILILADAGKLSLSDPVTRYFPDYPAQGKNITVEHLLTHTSGLVNYSSKLGFALGRRRDRSMEQMLGTFKDDPLEFAPGTRYAYNNSGYYLLGAIIEKVSGQPYAKFIEQRIFTPLGMMQTGYEGFESRPAVRAAGHTPNMFGGFGSAWALSMSQAYAAGAIVSTVDDMAKWDAAVSSAKLLKPATWAQAMTPYKLANGKLTTYGYAWQTGTVRGASEMGHGGDINGFSAYSLRLPDQKVYVVVMTNTDAGLARPVMVARKAAAIAIGKPYPEYKAVAVAADALDAYQGDYKLNDTVNRTILRDGDHLQVERPGRPNVQIHPLGGDRFFSRDTVTEYRFRRNAAGAIEQFIMDDDGVEQVHVRMK